MPALWVGSHGANCTTISYQLTTKGGVLENESPFTTDCNPGTPNCSCRVFCAASIMLSVSQPVGDLTELGGFPSDCSLAKLCAVRRILTVRKVSVHILH